MATSLTERLGIRHPLIQAPMAGVSTPALAAAVSNAGALGSIGVGASSVDKARSMIAETRKLTDAPFNVNLFCHQPAHRDARREAAWLHHLAPWFAEFDATPPEAIHEIYQSFITDAAMLEMLLEARPAVVSFHFGLPSAAVIDQLKGANIRLLGCATCPAEAFAIEQAGLDAVVLQGVEAGGHRGLFDPQLGDPGMGTLDLVRTLAGRLTLPVIAAGGLMNGQAIREVLALGAEAAQLGTAFVACPESSANAAYRERLLHAQPGDSQITAAISGRPARGLINRFFLEVGRPLAGRLPDYPVAYDAAKALNAAASARGCAEFAPHWAGTGAALARAMPAAEMVQTLLREMQ